MRLPVQVEVVDATLGWLCEQLDSLRGLEVDDEPLPADHPPLVYFAIFPTRKPLAYLLTVIAANAYLRVTGELPRRTSKYVKGRNGKQETGAFARFLAELFDILHIKASAAGQVRKLDAEVIEIMRRG